MNISLLANNATERRVLEYLQQNASEVLAEKINAGKKTLAGCLDYAKSEAKKLAGGECCVCVDDVTVFGWIIHYFEEDHIAEKAKAGPRLPGSASATTPNTMKASRDAVKARRKAVTAATPEPVQAAKPAPAIEQPTMFDALFGEAKA